MLNPPLPGEGSPVILDFWPDHHPDGADAAAFPGLAATWTYGAGGLRLVMTSGFGTRRDPVTGAPKENHNGIDIALPHGSAVVAAGPGKVTATWDNDPLNGTALVVDHRPYGLPYVTSYVHLSRRDVGKGAVVKAGQVIGLSGGTRGTWGAGKSTGPHLHFGVRSYDAGRAGARVDPLSVVDWTGVQLVDRNGRAVHS